MKKIAYMSLLLGTIFCITTCSTDIDINEEYKDISIVYGLLNQNDTNHFIKINKAFLGEDNALIMAGDPLNCNYPYDLNVTVEKWKKGNLVYVYQCDTITITDKDTGIFFYPKQVLYTFTHYRLDQDYDYKVVIDNPHTGKMVTAETPLVKSFRIDKPSSGAINIEFTSKIQKYIEWNSAVNGKYYEAVVRFNYYEEDKNTSVLDSSLYVDWFLGSTRSASVDGGESMALGYMPENFYSNVASKLAVNEDVIRYPGKVEFIISVASDDYAIYMDVNSPSSSIVQEKPEFTNINNGLGLFASRYDNRVDRPRIYNLLLRSRDSLKNGRYTHNLGFEMGF